MAAWAIYVAFEDVRTRRIRNGALLIPLVVAGLSLWLTGRGPLGVGAVAGIIGALLAAAFWLPGYWLRQLGAGDVKLAACVGLLAGVAGAVEVTLVAAVVLGLGAVVAKWGVRSSARLPAAVALSAGLLVWMGWGPLWTG